MALEYPDRPEMQVSHETIYQSLFVQSRGALRKELHSCLRSGRAMRRPKTYVKANHVGAGKIKDMVMISERPAEVKDRAVPGHWEGDPIFGKKMTSIGTLVERQSRYVILLKLPNGNGVEAVRQTMTKRILTLPAQLRRSITWDQGKEMAEHVRVTVETGVQVYFCDAKSPWQRGTNENTNGLLRQYLPTSSDISNPSEIGAQVRCRVRIAHGEEGDRGRLLKRDFARYSGFDSRLDAMRRASGTRWGAKCALYRLGRHGLWVLGSLGRCEIGIAARQRRRVAMVLIRSGDSRGSVDDG